MKSINRVFLFLLLAVLLISLLYGISTMAQTEANKEEPKIIKLTPEQQTGATVLLQEVRLKSAELNRAQAEYREYVTNLRLLLNLPPDKFDWQVDAQGNFAFVEKKDKK